jgi:hypothetical protein
VDVDFYCDDSIVLRAMTISAAEMLLLLCNGDNGQKRNRLTDPDPADCANPLNINFAILSYLYRFGTVQRSNKRNFEQLPL